MVEFAGHTFRFGIANDEVFSGLPLWKKGLKGYSAHIIDNSAWITKIKRINKVHPYYSEDMWKDKKHFALLFHDEIFEVIAADFKIETYYMTFERLAIEVAMQNEQMMYESYTNEQVMSRTRHGFESRRHTRKTMTVLSKTNGTVKKADN